MTNQYPEWECGNCSSRNVSLTNCNIPLNLLRDTQAMVKWLDEAAKYPANCYCARCGDDTMLERDDTPAEIKAKCDKITERMTNEES